jgi:hypothetical protein
VQSTGNLRERVIVKTLRAPAADGASGDGAAAARQLDEQLSRALSAIRERPSGLACLWIVRRSVLQAGEAGAEVGGDRRQRRVHDGDVEHEHGRGRAQTTASVQRWM